MEDAVAKGICREVGGWGNEDSVLVDYEDGKGRKELMPASLYTQRGYLPPLDQLRICAPDEKNAQRS